MPFYVSPEQQMKDKADYARKGIARGRNSVVLQYDEGILFVAPNPSSALHKVSEIYDRIAFAAVGRYNEYENLRVAGVRFADTRGYQYAREDVTARGLANWYAQVLGSIFTESNKPYEVEIVVAELGETPDGDQMYRITFDGSVADEHGFVTMGGQAEQVAGVLKERYAPGLPVERALAAAIAALSSQNNGEGSEINASQLEVAVLVRGRAHRAFRRITGARLEELLAKATSSPASGKGTKAGGKGAADNGAADNGAADEPPPGDGTAP
jgi:proteasome alpha subunit